MRLRRHALASHKRKKDAQENGCPALFVSSQQHQTNTNKLSSPRRLLLFRQWLFSQWLCLHQEVSNGEVHMFMHFACSSSCDKELDADDYPPRCPKPPFELARLGIVEDRLAHWVKPPQRLTIYSSLCDGPTEGELKTPEGSNGTHATLANYKVSLAQFQRFQFSDIGRKRENLAAPPRWIFAEPHRLHTQPLLLSRPRCPIDSI
jgi:hypothetical protein